MFSMDYEVNKKINDNECDMWTKADSDITIIAIRSSYSEQILDNHCSGHFLNWTVHRTTLRSAATGVGAGNLPFLNLLRLYKFVMFCPMFSLTLPVGSLAR